MAEQLAFADLQEAYLRRMALGASGTPDYSNTSSRSSLAHKHLLDGVPSASENLCRPGLLDAIRTAFRERKWPVYLHGETGVGKSCAAAVVFRNFLSRRADPPWPRWCTWPLFCDRVAQLARDGRFLETGVDGLCYEIDPRGWWTCRYQTAPLVVVDEVGVRAVTDVRLEAMWRLLEVRRDKPTILIGNLNAGEIQQVYDDRILSRMVEGSWIKLDGPDRRAEGFGQRAVLIK